MPRRFAQIALASLLAGAACGGGQAPSTGAAPTGPRVVEVAPAVRTTHARTVTLSGTLTPLERVQVAARVEGPITDVRVDLGDVVTRDQVLAAIRPVDYRARVSELDAGLAQAQADVQRAQGLGDAGTASLFDDAGEGLRRLGARLRAR